MKKYTTTALTLLALLACQQLAVQFKNHEG